MRAERNSESEDHRQNGARHLVVVVDGINPAVKSIHLNARNANHRQRDEECEGVGSRPSSLLLHVHQGGNDQRRCPEQPRPAPSHQGFSILRTLTAHPRLMLRVAAATTCPLPRSTARGHALLTLASFGMVGWVMVRGLA